MQKKRIAKQKINQERSGERSYSRGRGIGGIERNRQKGQKLSSPRQKAQRKEKGGDGGGGGEGLVPGHRVKIREGLSFSQGKEKGRNNQEKTQNKQRKANKTSRGHITKMGRGGLDRVKKKD